MSSIEGTPAKVATPSLRAVGSTLLSKLRDTSRELLESGSTTQPQSRVKRTTQKFSWPSSQHSCTSSVDDSPPPSVSAKEGQRTSSPPPYIGDVPSTDTKQQARDVERTWSMDKSSESSVGVAQPRKRTASMISRTTDGFKRAGAVYGAQEKQKDMSGSGAELERPAMEAGFLDNVSTHPSGKPEQPNDSASWASSMNVLIRNIKVDTSQHGADLRDPSAQRQSRHAQVGKTSGHSGTPKLHQTPNSQAGATSRQGFTVEEASTHIASAPAQEESADADTMGKELARQCWEGSNGFLAKDEVAGWLGGQNQINKATLRHYLDLFKFSNLRLDMAFKLLCSKLHFKAEIQQVDRILEEFGRRYWECNPESIFGSAGVVRAISYSLVLLNKDFHVSETTDGTSIAQFVHDAIATAQVQHQSSGDPRDGSDSGVASVPSLASGTNPKPHVTPPAVTLKEPNMSRHPRSPPSPPATQLSHSRDPESPLSGSTSTISPATPSTSGSAQSHVQRPPTAPISDPSPGPVGQRHDHAREGKDLARRCWEEDKEFLAKDKITEWLSEQSPVSNIALQYYFQFFDFPGLRLDEAFRQLCKKLYLKAETQQVDRILEEFGKRYWECNPTSVFSSAGVAHVVSYSLLLLNTDLHVAESTKRMSSDEFVHNTMDAIQKYLHHTRPVASEGGSGTGDSTTSLPTTLSPPPLEVPSQQAEPLGPSSHADALPQTSSSGAPNDQESAPENPASIVLDEERRRQLKRTLKDIYNATKSKQIELDSAGVPLPPAPPPDETLLDIKKPVGFASALAQAIPRENRDDRQQSVPSVPIRNTDITDEELALLGAPWAKEGLLSRRYYKESPEKGTKSETWVDVFAVVQKDELLMFKFGSHSAESDGPVGDGKWWEKAQPVGRLQLAHSIAQARPPPGYSNERSNCMALTVADGSVYFFQAGTEALMNEWVSTCNYWAARRSKEPLAGGNTNMEYGWNRVFSMEPDRASILSTDTTRSKLSIATLRPQRRQRTGKAIIRDWKPLMSPRVTSMRSEEDQLEVLENHLLTLETKLGEHFTFFQPMIELHKPYPDDSAKAQDNWRKRTYYLQAEVFKYRLYIESLRSAITLQLEVHRRAACGGGHGRHNAGGR